MDKLKRFVFLILVLSAFAGTTVGFRVFFMTKIIEPIAVLFWTAWRIIISVNQNIYWMILIVICSFLMFHLLPVRRENSSSPAYTYRYKSPNQVEYWQTLMEESILGKEEGERLRINLENLFKSINAKPGRNVSSDLEENAANGQIPLPLRMKRCLFPSKQSDSVYFQNHHFGIMSIIPKRLRRWAGKFISQDATAIDEILEYMETEMEMSHDR